MIRIERIDDDRVLDTESMIHDRRYSIGVFPGFQVSRRGATGWASVCILVLYGALESTQGFLGRPPC